MILLSPHNPQQRMAIAKRLLTPSKESSFGGASKKVLCEVCLRRMCEWEGGREGREGGREGGRREGGRDGWMDGWMDGGERDGEREGWMDG